MAVSRFASLLDGLYEGWLDDPVFRPIVDQDLLDGQHRGAAHSTRPEFFTIAYFHTPDSPAGEIGQAGFTGTAVYGVEAQAGRCTGSGQIRSGASRSCSQPAQPRHSPPSSASALTSSPPRPSHSKPSQTLAMRHESP
jgi:hypothetical protein